MLKLNINNLEQYSESQQNVFQYLTELKNQDNKIAGYFCTYTPLEVLDAAGLIPVRLCGTSSETIAIAEEDLPKNICPLIKSSYGSVLTNAFPYVLTDMIVAETTCDGKKKMFDMLENVKPTYILQLPQGTDLSYAKKLWVSEIRRFVDFISSKYNVNITTDMLVDAARKRNGLRLAQIELMELLKQPAPINSGVYLYRFFELLSLLPVDDALAVTRSLIEKLKAQTSTMNISKKRVLITGCPIGGVLNKVVETIENNDGVVVCMENCYGYKSASSIVDITQDDIIESIADAYMQIGCSVMSPNIHRIINLPQLIHDFEVQGVIDVTLQTCTTYMIETNAVRELCNDMAVRYMSVETDYSQEDTGQIETRISAFLETLC